MVNMDIRNKARLNLVEVSAMCSINCPEMRDLNTHGLRGKQKMHRKTSLCINRISRKFLYLVGVNIPFNPKNN